MFQSVLMLTFLKQAVVCVILCVGVCGAAINV